MRLKTQRRVIYATMGLTVLALIGGFAAATLTTNVTSPGQNGYTISAPGNTIYGGHQPTEQLQYTQATDGTSGGCSVNGADVAASAGATSAEVFVNGTVTCQTTNPDWFEGITFTSGTLPVTSVSDLFVITCSDNPSISVTVSFSALPMGSVVTTTILYEVGSNANPVACEIAVSGS